MHAPRLPSPRARHRWTGYAAAALGVAAVTWLIHFVEGGKHIDNISMLYLLVVIGAAVGFGSGPAVVASLLAFLTFDFFFVEPRHTFTVRDPSEWLALLLFLVTAGVTGQLTALQRARAEEARRRERETAALAAVSGAVAAQVAPDRALAEVLRQLAAVVHPAAAAIGVAELGGPVEVVARRLEPGEALPDFGAAPAAPLARSGLDEGRPAAWEGDPRHWEKAAGEAGDSYLPLTIEDRVLGLLYLRLPPGRWVSPEERRVVESLASQAAVVLERDRLARAETAAQALAEADRLKTALLSMVSHDFLSPLTSIKASVGSLLQGEGPGDAATRAELLRGIETEADRLNRMVGNILSLSRLEADAWRPQREPTPVDELVGAALGTFGADENRRIAVTLEPALPELSFDAVQMVQVLRNLVDNALKYSPPETLVEIRAFREDERAVVEVRDRGRGIPPGDEEQLFKPFYRAPELRESAVPGVGIGLAVCRGLVEAHHGELRAANRDGGGAVFRLTLPLEE